MCLLNLQMVLSWEWIWELWRAGLESKQTWQIDQMVWKKYDAIQEGEMQRAALGWEQSNCTKMELEDKVQAASCRKMWWAARAIWDLMLVVGLVASKSSLCFSYRPMWTVSLWPVLQPQKQFEFVGRSRQLQQGFTRGFALVCVHAFGDKVQNCSPGLRSRYSTPCTGQAVQKTSTGTHCCLPGLTECSCRVRFFILTSQKSFPAVGFMLLVMLGGCCPECSTTACLKSVAWNCWCSVQLLIAQKVTYTAPLWCFLLRR